MNGKQKKTKKNMTTETKRILTLAQEIKGDNGTRERAVACAMQFLGYWGRITFNEVMQAWIDHDLEQYQKTVNFAGFNPCI